MYYQPCTFTAYPLTAVSVIQCVGKRHLVGLPEAILSKGHNPCIGKKFCEGYQLVRSRTSCEEKFLEISSAPRIKYTCSLHPSNLANSTLVFASYKPHVTFCPLSGTATAPVFLGTQPASIPRVITASFHGPLLSTVRLPRNLNPTHHGRRDKSPQCENSLQQVHRLLLLDSYVLPGSASADVCA
jgi:hypothetical protein